MTKYEKEEEIRAYTLVHVEEILSFLEAQNIKIKCFKNLFKNEFILQVDKITCECRSCKEVCEILEPLFFETKKKAFSEYVRKKLECIKEV